MKKLITVLLVCFALIATTTMATEQQTSVAAEAVVNFLSAVVWPVLSALGIALVGILTAWLKRKYNVQVSEAQQAKIEGLVLAGIAMAEKKAAKQIKQKVKKFTGKDKLDFVLAKVLESAPDVSPEQADKLVHDLLARLEAEKNAPKG